MTNKDKILNTALYIISKCKKVGFHKLFKILYFAEKKHLSRYGSPILNDQFIAMENGPVPSYLYDFLKIVRGEFAIESDEYDRYFTVRGYNVSVNQVSPDLDYLSESELECLDESFEENKGLSFGELKEKSHGPAWRNVDRNDKISLLEMAKEEDVDDEFLKYIQTKLENQNLKLA